MPSDDIVSRLRAVLHNDRSVELMNREAADEIKRLRNQLTERIHMCDMRSEKILELTAERDVARREVCDMEGETAGGALLEADRRGWDCFKEER
jgi:hypothetical protein